MSKKLTLDDALEEVALSFMKAGKTKRDFLAKMESYWDNAAYIWDAIEDSLNEV